MPQTIDTTKRILNETFRRGEQFTRIVTAYNESGTAISTISSARIKFFDGTLASPGSEVSSSTTSVTVGSSTTMTYTVTSAVTALFTVGEDYCYCLEATLADGSIYTILQGAIEAHKEIA